jgi:hydroxymethylglutaryl-CoA lyase
MNTESLKLIECPRDAMQGIHQFIPTDQKVKYLQSLLKVGFDTLDFGSYVSAPAIPQLRDTDEVLDRLDLSNTKTKLLAIIANKKGAEAAARRPEITYLGFPFAVSEIFQKRNTNKTISESISLVRELIEICSVNNKELVVYISMGFGNPYNEPWSVSIVEQYCEKLIAMGVKILSLSDTIGTSNPENIHYLFSSLIGAFPQVEFGAHLHTTSDTWHEKVQAAYNAGCLRFDGAIKGFGGCPFASDELTGNMPTEKLLTFVQEKKLNHQFDLLAFESAYNEALRTFPL